jgi:hypothetical protein
MCWFRREERRGQRRKRNLIHGIRHTSHLVETNTFINYSVYLTTLTELQELHYIHT